jgi:hypothetical protein
MNFYIVVHTFLGLLLISSNLLVMEGKANPAQVPKWVWGFGPQLTLFAMAACIAAIITTFVKFDLIWAGATVAEMALGAVIAHAIPMGLRALITITSPISVIVILGDLWGFWYI